MQVSTIMDERIVSESREFRKREAEMIVLLNATSLWNAVCFHKLELLAKVTNFMAVVALAD